LFKYIHSNISFILFSFLQLSEKVLNLASIVDVSRLGVAAIRNRATYLQSETSVITKFSIWLRCFLPKKCQENLLD